MKYFDEKESQVKPGSLEAFGISIESRYSKAEEIIEMLNFTKELALNNVAHYVTSVFYDSKATICSFEFDQTIQDGDPIAIQIQIAADKTISHFDIFGNVNYDPKIAGMESTMQ